MMKDSISLLFMASGFFFTFYNLGAVARLASIDNQPQILITQEQQQWY